MKKITRILLPILLLFLGTALVFGEENTKIDSSKKEVESIVCPADAKLCPDGSYVGRKGPKCDFVPCPDEKKEDNKEEELLKESPKVIYLGPPEKAEELKGRVCTREFNPVCGTVDTGIRCITEPCPSSVRKTFSNKCLARVAGATEIEEGLCEENNGALLGVLKTESDEVEEPVLNGEQKNKFLIESIKKAKNEEERRAVFSGISFVSANKLKKDEGAVEGEDEKTVLLEKRKEEIEKKSKEIFSKFDYFSEKLESIIDKIDEKISSIENFELNESFQMAKDLLEKSSEYKVNAWLEFNTLVEVKDKNKARLKIERTKELLEEAKSNLKASFDLLKDVVLYLKK